MDKLQILRIKFSAVLELFQVLEGNAEKIFKEYENASIENKDKFAAKYLNYCTFMIDVREYLDTMKDEYDEIKKLGEKNNVK